MPTILNIIFLWETKEFIQKGQEATKEQPKRQEDKAFPSLKEDLSKLMVSRM